MLEGLEAGAPLLELRSARVVRSGRAVLDIERLVLRQGEHVAVLGPNGAGKSTLIKLITREARPLYSETPSVLLLGRERWDLFQARSLFGIVSEDLQEAYDRPLRVRDAVLSGFFGSVGLYPNLHVTAEMGRKADELLGLLGIEHLAGRSMDTLSTGEARRALIARALVHDPPALILDEPADGLDPEAAFRFLETVRAIASSGRTLVLVTHHVDDIVPEVERVVMLRAGKVFRDVPKGEALTSGAMRELFGVPSRLEERGGWYRMWPG